MKNGNIIRSVAITISGLIIIYLLPLFFTIKVDTNTSFNNEDGLKDAWVRGILFASISTIFNLFSSLLIAIKLRNIVFFSKYGKFLSILLIPILLGNVSIAFIWKNVISDIAFLHQYSWIKLVSIGFIQFWQFGSLFIYLFWLSFQNIPKTTWEYAEAFQLSLSEKIRDIILPSCKNLSILLFTLNFLFSLYEDAKAQFIFKVSRGTNTELISQWLNRTYYSLSLTKPSIAIQKIINYSWVIMVISIIVISFLIFLYFILFDFVLKSRKPLPVKGTLFINKSYIPIIVIIVIAPIFLTFYQTNIILNIQLSHLFQPIMFTGIAALFSTILSCFLGILLRLGWKNTFDTFNYYSIIFFISIFFVQFIPPVSLLIIGFQWVKWINYHNELYIYLIWIMGHIILILPLLGSFITVTHFRVKNKEIDYFQAYKLTLRQLIKDIFFRRFIIDYVLTFLISFSLIWNESIINNILSDSIPSFVSELKMNIEGRNVDYGKGGTYLLISLLVATIALYIWNIILNQANKKINENNFY